MRVTLLGVHHTSAASVDEAREVVSGAIERGSLAVLALETDDETLLVQRAASTALAGLSDAAIRRDGVRAVQGALFDLPSVRSRLGAALSSPEQIVLSADLKRGLQAGRVHGREMAAAADLAERAAVRVVCIDSPPAVKCARYEAAASLDTPTAWSTLAAHLGQACELRARALLRGGVLAIDDQLCALRRFMPATYRAVVDERDVEMASRIHSLCAQLAPPPQTGMPNSKGAVGRDVSMSNASVEIVVLCGAAHLEGLEARLRTTALNQHDDILPPVAVQR